MLAALVRVCGYPTRENTMPRNVMILGIVGIVCFLIGALSPLLNIDAPTWIFTWIGIALVVVAVILWIVQRGKTKP
jgi:hypothetical protein